VKGTKRVTFYQSGEISSIEGYYRADVEKIVDAVRARDSWRAHNERVAAHQAASKERDVPDDQR
jgi:hypothetical protein